MALGGAFSEKAVCGRVTALHRHHVRAFGKATCDRKRLPGAFVFGFGENRVSVLDDSTIARIAEAHGNDYGLALALVVGLAGIVIMLLMALGPERRGVSMDSRPAGAASN